MATLQNTMTFCSVNTFTNRVARRTTSLLMLSRGRVGVKPRSCLICTSAPERIAVVSFTQPSTATATRVPIHLFLYNGIAATALILPGFSLL